MGSEASMNIHICGLDFNNEENYRLQLKVIEQIFPTRDEENSNTSYELRKSKAPKWNAFIYRINDYPLMKTTILEQIRLGAENNNRRKELKNNMILCFGDNNNDLLLCKEFTKRETQKKFAHNFPLILFVFKELNKQNLDYKDTIFDFSYIKCVNYNDLSKMPIQNNDNNEENTSIVKLISLSLKSLLLNRYDSYYNEDGYNTIKHIDPLSYKLKTAIYLPVLLIGCPGVGKSTFINVFAGERISKASSSMEPVTNKVAYYDVKFPENPREILNNELNNPLLNEEVFIRFIDTPGFDTKKDVDKTKDELENIFEKFEEGKERIPVILYFLQNGRSFSSQNDRKELEVLKYLEKKEAKILFIIPRCPDNIWEQTDSFISFLEEKKLGNLVEEDESNIIPCNLRGKNAFGIKEIFDKLYSKLNTINGKDIYSESLIREIQEKPTFDDKLQLLKERTSLFNSFDSKNDLIKYANRKAKLLITSLSLAAAAAGAIPFPFVDVAIVNALIVTSILSIGKFYGYIFKKISKNDILSILKGSLYNVNDNHNNEEYFDADISSVQRINNKDRNSNNISSFIIANISSSILTLTALLIDDGIKVIPIIGAVLGSVIGALCDFGLVIKFGRNANKYFKSKCEADDGTIFFCTRCYEYEAIFKKFKNFSSYDLIYP